MRSVSMAWAVSITVCIAVCCGVTSVANASLLRDVRVGEHKDFTRLTFEFDSFTRYSQPVLEDKDTISVTFSKSTSPYTQTRHNLQRSKRHFDTIVFDQRGSDLTANVTVTSPHFELKTFSLLKPYRVVIDVCWLDAPLQARVAPLPAQENVKKPEPLTPEEIEPESTKEITPPPKPQMSDMLPAMITPEKIVKMSEGEVAEPESTKKIEPLPEPQKSDMPVVIAAEKIAKMPEGEEATFKQPDKVVAVSPPLQTTTPNAMQLAEVTPPYSRLQRYLVVVLIALNVIIISFAVMNWSRKRKTELVTSGENDELADAFAMQDSTVVSIDSEIREKFRKYEAL